jgi:hypothetical protein
MKRTRACRLRPSQQDTKSILRANDLPTGRAMHGNCAVCLRAAGLANLHRFPSSIIDREQAAKIVRLAALAGKARSFTDGPSPIEPTFRNAFPKIWNYALFSAAWILARVSIQPT